MTINAEPAVTKPPASRLWRGLAFALYNIIAAAALFLLAEGGASTYHAFRSAYAETQGSRDSLGIFRTSGVSAEYDAELGWRNAPNVDFPNMYGPGKYLRTNSQGFRAGADFAPTVPPDRTRIICSGDSMTFGLGVDNEHTWPQLLASQAPGIETINMGLGGYGADQAYLWYKRDGAVMNPDIHILALIYPDIYRMQHSAFNGYAKPVLKIEDGRLAVTNVPVPRSLEFWAPKLTRLQTALSNLSISAQLRNALNLNAIERIVPSGEKNEETREVMTLMLDDLRAINRAKGAVFVLAYLPIQQELGWTSPRYWRAFLEEYARVHRVPFIDLAADFSRLPAKDTDQLYIANAVGAQGAAGHYSEAGNAFVAKLIYQRLLGDPQTAAKLHSR